MARSICAEEAGRKSNRRRRGEAPYKSILTHGFVVDGKGQKMSKSIGNVIAPDEIIKKNGADILRLWVVASDYSEDLRIDQSIITQHSESYRKIRNTLRFLLGNILDEFSFHEFQNFDDGYPVIALFVCYWWARCTFD